MSSSSTSTTTSAASSSTSASSTIQVPANLKVVGILLAIISGILIGSSFVFKKKGLLKAQAGGPAGEGVAYLKSWLWWIGMIMMILGEVCNFAAYAFVEAIVVTPFGALSVVISAILSSIFLNEKLTFFGWLGCGLCILGSVIIALNGPSESSIGQIKEFQALFLAPGFLAFGGTFIAASFIIILFVAPKYGKTNMIWYISVCSMIGGISVSVTTGLGSAIVTTVMGDSQFKYWFTYFLIAFVAVTLVTEVFYLNVALALFNTAMVTPTYYVIFTFCSMVSTIVLFKGLKAPVTQIITLVMGFLVICFGIIVLQMSRVDPVHFKGLDRKSTILLQASRSRTEGTDMDSEEKSMAGVEDPGIDSLRGSFGMIGSIIRARSARTMSMSSKGSQRVSSAGDGELRARYPRPRNSDSVDGMPGADRSHYGGLKRHQLYDAPVPERSPSKDSPAIPRQPTIKFDNKDLVHSYGPGANATHELRGAAHPPPVPTLDAEDPFGTPPEHSGLSTINTSPVEGFASFDQPSTTNLMSSNSDAHLPVPDSRPHGRSTERRYPRGNAADDRAERESLWYQRDSDEENSRGYDDSEHGRDLGGIRLVTKSRI